METWKIVNHEYGPYEVSDLGNIRRIGARGNKKATKATVGYFVVNLWLNNTGRVLYVHALVAEAFIGPRPEGWTVNHIDGNKLNNLPSNLEYVTYAGNNEHARDTGLNELNGESNYAAKLSETQVREIYRRAHEGERTCDLAREFNMGSPIISQIKHRSRWKHIH